MKGRALPSLLLFLASAPLKLPTYGGQAVIEGVMMRGRQHYAVAVRLPEKNGQTGEIRIDRGELRSGLYRHPSGSCRSRAASRCWWSSSTSA